MTASSNGTFMIFDVEQGRLGASLKLALGYGRCAKHILGITEDRQGNPGSFEEYASVDHKQGTGTGSSGLDRWS